MLNMLGVVLQESARPSGPGSASRGGPPLKDDTDDEDEGNAGDLKSDLHETTLFPLDRVGNDNSDAEGELYLSLPSTLPAHFS